MPNIALRKIRQINFYKDMGVLNLRIRSVSKSIRAFSAFGSQPSRDYQERLDAILTPKYEELSMLLARKTTMIRRFVEANKEDEA